MLRLGLVFFLTGSLVMAATAADKNPALKVLLIDGQNKAHDWQSTSVVMLKQLELNANFRVTRLTTPADGKPASWKNFEPDFKAYDLVVAQLLGHRLAQGGLHPPQGIRQRWRRLGDRPFRLGRL